MTINLDQIKSLKSSISILTRFKWLYDFQVTQIFTDYILDTHFPNDWKLYFEANDIEEFKLLIDMNNEALQHSACPQSLREFLIELNDLKSCSTSLSNQQTSEVYRIDSNISRGMTAKKQYEISVMVPFIKQLCEQHGSKCVIDIGAGLGYFGQLLAHHTPDVDVINIECSQERTVLADKRLQNQNDVNKRLHNLTYTIRDNCEEEFGNFLNDSLKELNNNTGMVSLHSCGDLTPQMLKIFKHNERIKFLMAFSCCYHRMNNSDMGGKFGNFPMSNTLRELIKNECPGFDLSVFAMRLACQETIATWQSKSLDKHTEHMKQVGYRAILEAFCVQNNLKIVKLKRKLANLNEFKDFSSYIESIKERAQFTGDLSGIDIQTGLTQLHDYYSKLFYLIEPLTILQALMQPVLEWFLLNDRLAYLSENNFNANLIKLFDDKISPRCICIVANK